MEQHHRRLIDKNISKLVFLTSDLENIIRSLLQKSVINKWMAEYIMVNILSYKILCNLNTSNTSQILVLTDSKQ